MGVAAVVREQFMKAQEYEAGCREATSIARRPKFDFALHTLAEVMARKTPVTFYAHKANDIVTAVRLTREFDLDGIIVGATEGCLVAEFLGECGVPVVFIPLLDGRMSVETRNATFETAAVLAAAGVDVAISTGAPSLPSEYLPVIAALCMKAGLARDTALRAITSSPAAIFGLVQNGPQNTAGPGHIACGAPADLVVWEGDPFSLTGRPRLVIASGNVAFDSCINEAPW
jgi:imidazolonepropionase-like amidohydrolase